MSNQDFPLSCAECGAYLGFGSLSALSYCSKCGHWVQARARTVGPGEALVAAALAIGIGVLLAVAIERGLKAFRDFVNSL